MIELRGRPARLLVQLVVTLAVVPFVLPLVAMLRTSLEGAGFDNYRHVVEQPLFPRFFLNSAIIASGTVLIVYVGAMLAGYAFAKLRFRGKEPIFYTLLMALTLPGVVLLVPLFLTVQRLGLFDTYWAVILPLAALGTPFAVLLARNFISGLPDDVIDAARIDGCTTLGAFRHVVLPLSRPITAVIVLFTFLAAWNEFLLPLLFLQDPNKQAITQVPRAFATEYGSNQPQIVAASVLISVPVVIAYLSLQRLFERGIVAGALK